jgi:5-methylcytosine-specific restriction protein A
LKSDITKKTILKKEYTMDTVSTKEQIRDNIELFEKYLRDDAEEQKFAHGLIGRGKNFIAYKIDDEFRFAPSRYIGYVDNTKDKHNNNSTKDGKKTDPAITKIVDHNLSPSEELETAYFSFTSKLDIKPNNIENRKYWELDL